MAKSTSLLRPESKATDLGRTATVGVKRAARAIRLTGRLRKKSLRIGRLQALLVDPSYERRLVLMVGALRPSRFESMLLALAVIGSSKPFTSCGCRRSSCETLVTPT